MAAWQKLRFIAFVLVTVGLSASLVVAQQSTPPSFVLGHVYQNGSDQLIKIRMNNWLLPDPFSPVAEEGGPSLRVRVSGYPLLGDWNGDGKDTPGVFTPEGWFHLNARLSGRGDIAFAFGQMGDIPVVGDWDGDGIDTVGVYRAGTWYLTNTHAAEGALSPVVFGTSADYPVAGDWDNDGQSTIGLYYASVFTLSDDLLGDSLTFVSMPQAEGHPVTFHEISGDSVALVDMPSGGVGDEPGGSGKLIIRPGSQGGVPEEVF